MADTEGALPPPGAVPGMSGPPAEPPGAAAPPVVCPFLASIDLEDRVGPALPVVDTANRCLSTGEPFAPSARDQRGLCLGGGHTRCARFVRATGTPDQDEPSAVVTIRRRRLSGPILAALAVLVLAVVLAAASIAARGDLSAGVAPASGTPTSGATSAPSAGAAVAAVPTASAGAPAPSGSSTSTAVPSDVTASGGPAGSPPPAPSATPGAAVQAATSEPAPQTPAATPAPPAPTPVATPRRIRGLTPCPDAADCYIYVVKRNDTLYSIAVRYGLTRDAVLRMNPAITDPAIIVVGQEIRIPTPTNR